MIKKIKYIIQSLKTPNRMKIINLNKKFIPEIEIYESINGYNINTTILSLFKSKIKFVNLDFNTYGTLANFLTKVNILKYQIENNIDYICLLEDDILITQYFKNFVEFHLPLLNQYHVLRLGNNSEGYIFSLEGAKYVISIIYKIGIIKNFHNQLRENCKMEKRILNTPWKLLIPTNYGDCLNTENISEIKKKELNNYN